MTSIRRYLALTALMGFIFLGGAIVATVAADTAGGGKGDRQAAQLFSQGMAAINAKQYARAATFFTKANDYKANDPDILNMLAYSHCKLSNLDEAFTHYNTALKIRPRFPEAREYLGEAHIQGTLKQIKILQSYGIEAKHETEELIDSLRRAAAKFDKTVAPKHAQSSGDADEEG